MEEIYLLSLDLFMLLAAMGITLGIIFIILRLELKEFGEHVRLMESKIIVWSTSDFQYLKSSVRNMTSEASAFNQDILSGRVNSDSDGLYRTRIRDVDALIQAEVTKDGIFQLRLEATGVRNDSTIIEINMYDKRGRIEDINELNKKVEIWPTLRNIQRKYLRQ